MRAIIRTDNPDALPGDLLVATKTMDKRESTPPGERAEVIGEETFALIEGVSGVGTLKGGSGVRIFTEADDEGILSIMSNPDGHFDHGGDSDDFTAELVSAGDDGTTFLNEPEGNEVEN